MGFWSWSKTAATNASADASINWAEGQPPSSVNDSARAMMAALKKWGDDISGAIVTGGTLTAYTLTSNSIFDTLAHMDGAMVAFSPHATCGATVTLNVDGLGAKPLRTSPSVELQAGTLILGTPYVATYSNADSVWYLRGFYGNAFNLPLGGILPYIGTSAPNSAFALPYGQAISRTTYATLFSLVSTTFGIGDGTTTFNVPDLRGRGISGKDDMGGSAASRLTSTYFGTSAAALGAVGGSESHTLTTPEIPSHTHVNTLTDPGHTHTYFRHNSSSVVASGDTFAHADQSQNTGSSTTGITITNAAAGGGGAHAIVPPTIICNYILRII